MTVRNLQLAMVLVGTTLLLGPAGAGAQPRPSGAKPAAGARGGSAAEVSARTLRNGMKVLVWPDHDIPNVSLHIYYRVGSRNERPGITGLSHFFEHMMFNGSKEYPSGEFDRVMEANGGGNNAWTSQDMTAYTDWFTKGALELIMRMEADRICCLRFDSTSVESERGVVASERRATTDNDNGEFLDEQVWAMAFAAHPYQIPIIGWPSDIERWSIADLQNYFRTYYAPNNATAVVVGDVTPDEVFALAERYWAPIPRQPAPMPVRTVEPPQLGERRVIVRRPGPTPILEVAFHAGPGGGPDVEAEEMLEAVLTHGESSRLYRRLVDRDRIAVDVSSYLHEGFDPGLFLIRVTVSPEAAPAAAESALVDELARVAREGVPEAELTKARNVLLAAHWRSLKAIDGKAEALGTEEVITGDYRRLFTTADRYRRVTGAQVRKVAARMFDERNRTVGVLAPTEETR